MKYPRSNGKVLQGKQRQKFNFWKKRFAEIIKITNDGYELKKKDVEILAWNLSFVLVCEEFNEKKNIKTA